MSDEHEELLFTATDPNGYKVVLSSAQYYGHIISSDKNHQAHPEFTPEEMKETIEDPIFIYEGNRPNNDVYISKKCAQYPYMYLKVAVTTYDDCGDVRTAHLDDSIIGGINVKEGGLKYANYKSGL